MAAESRTLERDPPEEEEGTQERAPTIDDAQASPQKAERERVRAEQGTTIEEMVMEDLAVERRQVENYTNFIREVGDRDPVTRRMLQDILKDTEHHASELRDMLQHRA